MKINLKKEELVQQILYALLGLAFIATLFITTQARSEPTVVGSDGVTMTGEITSIEGEGFSLKHDNGMTLVSLKDIEDKQKDALAKADLIKVGNMVTVTGELDKGSFNNPVVKASNIIVVGEAPAKSGPVVPVPVVPTPVTPTPVTPAP